MNVLVINAGSSSLKFQVIAADSEKIANGTEELLCRGQVEGIGGQAILTIQSHTGVRQKLTAPIREVSAALDHVLRWLASDSSGGCGNSQPGRHSRGGTQSGTWRRVVQGIRAHQ